MALSKGFPFFPPSLVLSTILSNFSNVAFLRELSFMFVVHLSPTPLDQVGKTWRWNLGRCRPNWPLPRSPRRKIQKPRNWNLFSLPPPLTPKISTPSHSHPTTNSSLPHLRTKLVNTKQSYAGFYSMYLRPSLKICVQGQRWRNCQRPVKFKSSDNMKYQLLVNLPKGFPPYFFSQLNFGRVKTGSFWGFSAVTDEVFGASIFHPSIKSSVCLCWIWKELLMASVCPPSLQSCSFMFVPTSPFLPQCLFFPLPCSLSL